MPTVPLPHLYLTDKNRSAIKPDRLPVMWKEIERYISGVQLNVPSAGITQITSVDGTVVVTNPTGPTTDLHVTPGAGSGGYASLTGPGQATSPGNLTQAGGFTINANTTMGILLTASGGMGGGAVNVMQLTVGTPVFASPNDSLTLQVTAPGGMSLQDRGGGGILINSILQVQLFAPVTTISRSISGTSQSVNLFTNNGNPNGSVTALQTGDVCFDSVTPGIWLAHAANNSSWTMYTNP